MKEVAAIVHRYLAVQDRVAESFVEEPEGFDFDDPVLQIKAIEKAMPNYFKENPECLKSPYLKA
jgi:hypothetical protein